MINSAHEAKWIYEDLGINLNRVGCVMADFTPPDLRLPEEWLYYAKNKERFWIDGVVKDSHITLKYGILPGVTKEHVDTVLGNWWPEDIHMKEVMVFDSSYDDEDYKCIVLSMESESLDDANKALSMLPSISTFRNYVPHLTLAYVKTQHVDESVAYCQSMVRGYDPEYLGLNYGDEIK